MFEKIDYKILKPKQQEIYNFQKLSALLADYGFATMKLSDDWQSADFIAQHFDGETFLKVQLKGRLTFDKKYCKKNILVGFPHKDDWYLYDHDALLDLFKDTYPKMVASVSWEERGNYSWPTLSKEHLLMLQTYKLD